MLLREGADKDLRKLSATAGFALLLFCAFLAHVQAIDITSAGAWNETIDASDLIAGAGSGLIDTYESANILILSIANCLDDTDNWRVDVKRADVVWHGDLFLSVRRTSDGTGSGTIAGGLSYIPVDAMDTAFFSGAGDRSNINLQFKLSGISLNLPPDIYSTVVVYTVIDTV
ncbi:MAG: hypothetical protein ACM3WV_09490 [Bacillota bacterium]